jgi:hypothetical protein
VENPVRFDGWCVVRQGLTTDAVAALLASRPGLSELDARRQVNRSVTTGSFILLLEAASWDLVTRLRRDPPNWVGVVRVYQQGFSPDEMQNLNFCPVHELYHGGCLGCHVCSGFFVEE